MVGEPFGISVELFGSSKRLNHHAPLCGGAVVHVGTAKGKQRAVRNLVASFCVEATSGGQRRSIVFRHACNCPLKKQYETHAGTRAQIRAFGASAESQNCVELRVFPVTRLLTVSLHRSACPAGVRREKNTDLQSTETRARTRQSRSVSRDVARMLYQKTKRPLRIAGPHVSIASPAPLSLLLSRKEHRRSQRPRGQAIPVAFPVSERQKTKHTKAHISYRTLPCDGKKTVAGSRRLNNCNLNARFAVDPRCYPGVRWLVHLSAAGRSCV